MAAGKGESNGFYRKTAIVTGGAKGIGPGAVLSFSLKTGANVVLADMNCDMATEVEQELKGRGLQAKAVKVNVKQVKRYRKDG